MNRNATSVGIRGKPNGWKGQWPPQTSLKLRRQSASLRQAPTGQAKRWNAKESAETRGQKLYDKAEQLAREADRNGGRLPVALLQEAASTGYAPAIYALANWHLHGKGVEKNYKQAVTLLKRAAAMKYPPAEYDLAVAYELGKGGLRKDSKAALDWYQRAAKDGDVDALTEVARCYYHGIGASRDFAKAIKWYRKAEQIKATPTPSMLSVWPMNMARVSERTSIQHCNGTGKQQSKETKKRRRHLLSGQNADNNPS